MILILSNQRIKNLEGVYANPSLISDIDISKASLIYTTDERVKKLAKNMKVEVKDFPKTFESDDENFIENTISEMGNIKNNDNNDILTPIIIDEPKNKSGRPKKSEKKDS